jgi:uncharacterized protein (TIGR00730 family)
MRVCVFCGSRNGVRTQYLDEARRLGELLAMRGVGLVYGGASVGLMGAVADGALAARGEVIGVLPQALVDREVAHRGLTKLHVVDNMHQRKAMMAELADAFVALPGGLGTLEETFEIATWALLGLHRKPLGLLDVDSYFRPLVDFLDHAVTEGFVDPQHRALFHVDADAAPLLDRLFLLSSRHA